MPRGSTAPRRRVADGFGTVAEVARERGSGHLTWRNGIPEDSISPADSTQVWQPRHP
ncbi:MAG: hypothetical protein ACLGI3_11945 [Actinomycetes bacterium]